jgi:hypothetical protein
LLTTDPAAALYISAILAARLYTANVALIEIKRQLETGKPRVAIAQTVEKIAELLSSAFRLRPRQAAPAQAGMRKYMGRETRPDPHR